jgi:hypothetical protein
MSSDIILNQPGRDASARKFVFFSLIIPWLLAVVLLAAHPLPAEAAPRNAPKPQTEISGRAVELQKRVVEGFNRAFDVALFKNQPGHYRDLGKSVSEMSARLPGSPKAPFLPDYESLWERLSASEREIREFAPVAYEKASEANSEVKRFLYDAEQLRSRAPQEPVPAVNAEFRGFFLDWKEAVSERQQDALDARNRSYRQWAEEFRLFVNNPASRGSTLKQRALSAEYIDAFLKLGKNESQEKVIDSSQFQTLQFMVRRADGDIPPALARVKWRWRYFELNRKLHETITAHGTVVEDILKRLDAGLSEADWQKLSHPPTPTAKTIRVEGMTFAPYAEYPASSVEVHIEDKVFKPTSPTWGPYEVATSAGMPAVSGKFITADGEVFMPSKVEFEKSRPGADRIAVNLYFDGPEKTESVWRISGEVVEKLSGKPIGGATVGVRDRSLTTNATGLFGPVEIPREVKSVAIVASVGDAGASAGAKRPATGDVFVRIPISLPVPDKKPMISFSKAFIAPHKEAYDPDEPVQLIVSYKASGIPEGQSVAATLKLRTRGNAKTYPPRGWLSIATQMQAGSGVLTIPFTLPKDILPGAYTLEAACEASGVEAGEVPSAAFSIGGNLQAETLFQAGMGLLEQCKPLDAEEKFNAAAELIGNSKAAFDQSLLARIAEATARAQAASATMLMTSDMLSFARASLKNCMPYEAMKALDSIKLDALPHACWQPTSREVLLLLAEAQEHINAVSAMQDALARGKSDLAACRFEQASAEFANPAFSGDKGCEEGERLSAEARLLAAEAGKLEKLAAALEAGLNSAAKAGKPSDAAKVLKTIDAHPRKECFEDQRNKARTLLAPAAPAAEKSLSVRIIGAPIAIMGSKHILQSAVLTGGSPVADPDAYSYRWETSDGKAVTGKKSVSFTPRNPGAKTITLTVTDSNGKTASTAMSITVPKLPRVAISAEKGQAQTGEKVHFAPTVEDEADHCPCTYQWQSSGISQTFSFQRVWFQYQKPGTHTISLTVTDRFGQTANAVSSIAVAKNSEQGRGKDPDKLQAEREKLEQERRRQQQEDAINEQRQRQRREKERLAEEERRRQQELQDRREEDPFFGDLRYTDQGQPGRKSPLEQLGDMLLQQQQQQERERQRLEKERQAEQQRLAQEEERRRRVEEENARMEQATRDKREKEMRALQENIRRWTAALKCFEDGKIKHPNSWLDCNDNWMMRSRDLEIAEHRRWIQNAQNRLQELRNAQ